MLLRRLILYISFFLILLSCGRAGERSSSPVDLTQVSVRAGLYSQSIPEDGWLYTDHCDSLLFSGLLGTADLTQAEVEPGVWLRKPLKYGACSPEAGTSRSTISRDGILGVYWWAWRARRVAPLERLMERLRLDNYQLRGEGTLGELLLTTAHISTLAEMIHVLGSDMDVSAERNIKYLSYFGSGATGFERHIQIWHILLRGEVYGYLSSDEQDRIVEHVTAQPRNPLYAAAYGKWIGGGQERTVQLLEELYPADRLPTSADYCPEWPLQKDEYEWAACPSEGMTHTGIDLVVVYELILK